MTKDETPNPEFTRISLGRDDQSRAESIQEIRTPVSE
jgi:hypothetical protein